MGTTATDKIFDIFINTGHWVIILWSFHIILNFPKILRLKSFGNSWGS